MSNINPACRQCRLRSDEASDLGLPCLLGPIHIGINVMLYNYNIFTLLYSLPTYMHGLRHSYTLYEYIASLSGVCYGFVYSMLMTDINTACKQCRP